MIPVILSGGSGTRLWPVSRASYPKQFCEFYDFSFLRDAIDRVGPMGNPIILTVEDMRSITQRLTSKLGFEMDQLIFEPMGKNTAPALALLCRILSLRNRGQEVVGVFPADHLISDRKAFLKAVALGEQVAKSGKVVTLGIPPKYPATGYGYIEIRMDAEGTSGSMATGLDQEPRAYDVAGFREKPSLAVAEEFFSSGKHYWNAGMFIFKVDSMISEFKTHLPELWQKMESLNHDLSNLKYTYANLESISIDYGIMEKLKNQVCIPCEMGWSDVGSWDELSRLEEETPQLKSESKAQVFSKDSTSNYVFSIRNKVVGLLGVEDLIVVDTPDALLVTKKGQSQKVKDLVDELRKAGLPEATEHPSEVRPWGGFEILSDRETFKTKIVRVDPGARLSYQSHQKRNEHWVIVKGEAEVTLDEKVFVKKTGESVFIPAGAKHRIANKGPGELLFVEVQTGTYFGEDDIHRYQDDYQRSPTR